MTDITQAAGDMQGLAGAIATIGAATEAAYQSCVEGMIGAAPPGTDIRKYGLAVEHVVCVVMRTIVCDMFDRLEHKDRIVDEPGLRARVEATTRVVIGALLEAARTRRTHR